MERHELDPIALVFGLLLTTIGLSVYADHAWEGLDVAAVTGAALVVAGLAFIVLTARRRLRGDVSATGSDQTSGADNGG